MSMRVLTALPVYNEEHHIAPVLAEVRKFADDILVVDDGSSDGTPQKLAAEAGIRTIRHPRNRGYGAGLKTAFEYALEQKFEVLVTIDCDGQHAPALIPEMAAKVFPEDGPPNDIVSGSRYLKSFNGDSVPPIERRKINATITEYLNENLGFAITDAFCGFKAYRVPVLAKFEITELGYAMPLQLWIQAMAHRMRILEMPVPLIYLEEERSFGGSLDDGQKRLAYYLEVLNRELANASYGCGSSGGSAGSGSAR